MKCEKCARELIGDSIVCAVCGHTSERAAGPPRAVISQIDLESLPDDSEANLIRFPQSSAPLPSPSPTPITEDAASIPRWRTEVRERARQYFQQRADAPLVADSIPESDLLPQNPIVEAALKRLQKTDESQPVDSQTSLATAGSGQLVRERRTTRNLSPPLSAGRGISQSGSGHGTADLATSTRHLPPSSSSTRAATIVTSDQVQATRVTPVSAATTAAIQLPQPLSSPVPASLWERTLAGLFDNVLIGMACVPLYSIRSITGLKYGRGDVYTMLWIAVWITFLYLLWTTLVARRTCGMAWRHLRVADAETRDFVLPPWRIFVRSICATVSMLFPPVNLLAIWVSGNRSSLADLASGTTILQTHISLPPPAKPS